MYTYVYISLSISIYIYIYTNTEKEFVDARPYLLASVSCRSASLLVSGVRRCADPIRGQFS